MTVKHVLITVLFTVKTLECFTRKTAFNRGSSHITMTQSPGNHIKLQIPSQQARFHISNKLPNETTLLTHKPHFG